MLSGASWFAGFTEVRSGGRRVLPGSLGSFGCTLVVVGFIRGCLVHSGPPCAFLSSSGTGAFFLGCALGIVRFIRGHSAAYWGSSGSSCVAGFIEVRPGDRRVYPGSLGLLRCVLTVVGLIWGRLVHWSAYWGSSGLCRVVLVS